ncbi:MAG: YtxH domain-containing protein [Chitinophagaceae bacterium]
MKNTQKILIALGAGLAIGGVLGVLYAPDKGSETRRKISEKGRKLSDKVKGTLKREKEEMQNRFDKVNGKLEELV